LVNLVKVRHLPVCAGRSYGKDTTP
jgi:hypothetical protein